MGRDIRAAVNDYFNNLKSWRLFPMEGAIDNLPAMCHHKSRLIQNSVQIGNSIDCSEEIAEELKQQLKVLMPWRKGPFNLFGCLIDTEWRSDLKWSRLESI